jgi:prepilin-type N-terminal cleavage/methylation domain-containing protein
MRSKKGGEVEMFMKIRRNRAAFTLVEIMIVVAIIGLLAALAIPGFVKARKQAQGRRILNDVRQIDAAIDQWALEKGKTNGTMWTDNLDEIEPYLKRTLVLTDILNNPYSTHLVGSNQIMISDSTKQALDGVGIDWGMY